MTGQKGMTLIEILVVLVLCAAVSAGIYRVFVAQTRAYTVQEQVIDVQQTLRGAMEILLRDLRMTGFDSDHINSQISISNPLIRGDDSVTVNYEYDHTTRYTVVYQRDAGTASLLRQLTETKADGTVTAGPQEAILENVDTLNFTYGVDRNEDGVMDDQDGDGVIGSGDWLPTANVGTGKVIAVRVAVTARPQEVNPDLDPMSPRTLTTAVTLRNLCLIR